VRRKKGDAGIARAHRVFLLSPANCAGRRATGILSPASAAPLATALRSREGAPLGDVFAFISGLYFRGKLTYARAFAHTGDVRDAAVGAGVRIITPNAGLSSPDARITRAEIRAFAREDIHADNARYRRPLEASARRLLEAVGPSCEVVLLGSLASPKYIEALTAIFGEQLCFPIDFVGRGDMSRGGLLLRQAAAGVELAYAKVVGATLRGRRPPKLPPVRRGSP
jgi:hypothetical protein